LVKENSKENQNPSEAKKAEAPETCGKSTIKGRKVAAAKSRTRAGSKAATPAIPVETPELSLLRHYESTQYNTFSGTATPTRSSSQATKTRNYGLPYQKLHDNTRRQG
jgi:hypothetical protein